MAGVPRPEPSNVPHFDIEQRKKTASLVYSESDYKELLDLEGTEEFFRRTDEAWSALLWHWQRRLGQQVVNRYGQARHDHTDQVITNDHISYAKFADTPPGLCWIFHELDLARVDGNFLGEWIETGNPPLIFNYRDPRDVVISLINFIEGRTRQGYGNFYEYDLFNAILKTKPTWEEKIDYVLREPSFIARTEFERATWLLNHPNVCKLRYEDLVGPNGGGSREGQLDAVTRLLRHIGDDRDPEQVLDRIYDPGSWSFFQGRIGAWRDKFTDANLARFKEVHGDLLEQYGYE
ncbi:hypothetical protein ACFOY2_13350 [Nonomuraea purpurea]|uniref:Sulfotransferase domain-containing protein n=1 Tax=Nonomuraea purpurea TaxID=1849276 RepID=A0ABV8G680_9ACTN